MIRNHNPLKKLPNTSHLTRKPSSKMAFVSPSHLLPRSLPARRQRFICKTSLPSPVSPETYLHSLGLSPEDTKRTLSRHPRLQTAHLCTQAEPIVAYLRTELGLSPRQIARAIRNAPQVLYNPTASFASRLSFLHHTAHISPNLHATVVAKCPHVLWMNLQNASAVVELLLQATPSVTPTVLGSMILARVPQSLILKPEKLAQNMEQIREMGNLDGNALGKVLCKMPLALVYSSQTLQKRLDYLLQTLHDPSTVGKVLVATPQLLAWGIESTLAPRIALLSSLVGTDALPQIFDKVPTLFEVSDIQNRVEWLKQMIGLSDEEVTHVLQQAPAILTYSIVGNLAPKWMFIHETMGGSKGDIVAAPRETLCANLQQRHMPRYAFLIGAGRTDVSVVDTLRGNDVEFCKNVAKCDPSEFRKYVDDDTYLLFFSQLM